MATAVAAISVFTPVDAATQADRPRARRDSIARGTERASIARDVAIPFTVGPTECADRTRMFPVTMRIYNVLAQLVAVATLGPVIQEGMVPPAGAGRPLNRTMLSCGRYVARWDGRHAGTGRRLAPGVYLSELVIDGQRSTRKITLGR